MTVAIQGYELDAVIGSGGFGEVWRARDLSRGVPVAVKLLKPLGSPEERRRSAREARVLSQLVHPNCVQFVASGKTEGGQRYIATELVDGVPLDRWLASNPSHADKLTVAIQVADCLVYAHRNGIVHRDLKPANVLVTTGPEPVAKVLDFGIARLVGIVRDDITKSGVVIGTAGHMSPEQLRGSKGIGPSTDQYSFGVMLFEMFTGAPPFAGRTPLELGMAHLSQPVPTTPPHLHPRLGGLITRMLAKDPSQRFAGMGSVLRELQEVAGRGATSTARDDQRPPTKRWPMVAALAAVLVVLIAAWLVFRHHDHTPRVVVAPRPTAEPSTTPAASTKTAAVREVAQEVVSAASGGCGRAVTGVGRTSGHGTGSAMQVYIPNGYDPARAHGLVAMFHEGAQTPEEFLKEADLFALADEMGLILAAPNGHGGGIGTLVEQVTQRPMQSGPVQWDSTRRNRARHDLIALGDTLCIDPSRVFYMGHGRGGRAVENLLCDRDEQQPVAGAIVWSHRLNKEDDLCADPFEVPYLNLSSKSDRRNPIKGGDVGIHNVMPLKEHEEQILRANRCVEKPTIDEFACRVYDCPAQLRSCVLKGGRHGPSHPAFDRKAGFDDKVYRGAIRSFIADHSRPRVVPAEVVKSTGCGKPRPKSPKNFAQIGDDDGEIVYAWPRAYDAEKAYPVVLMFHDRAQSAQRHLNETNVLDALDEFDFVAIVPRNKLLAYQPVWQQTRRYESIAREAIDAVGRQLCIDTNRITVVGYGDGGRVAENLPCKIDEVRATATWSYRPSGRPECKRPLPRAHLMGIDNRIFPMDGTPSCRRPYARSHSHEQYSQTLRELNLCNDKPTTSTSEDDESACTTWQCESPVLVCKFAGGHGFVNTHPDDATGRCVGPRPSFDQSGELLKFFSSVLPPTL